MVDYMCEIPSWFETVFELFKMDIISSETFANAINFLISKGLASCTKIAQA
jgi:hypothetical protein